MLQKLTEEFADLLESPKYLPCISLIMPFEPKMSLQTELAYRLKIATDKIGGELMANYPDDKAKPVLKKLQQVIRNLDYHTYKKSVAIFVSPLIEKVFYLDIAVEEKIIIDDSFEIRDLIYSKKQIHKYLLAVLSSKWTKVYLGNTTQFIPVILNVPDNVAAYMNDIPEKVSSYGDTNKQKEILLDKFLQHTDNGLSILLQSYRLPLFIMGTARTLGHFKSLTHNARQVVEYIPGNFEDKTEPELQKIMQPYVADWKKIIQHDLLHQIDDAMSHKRLAVGIHDVWKAATHKKGRLLVVEKNYIYPAEQSADADIILSHEAGSNNTFYIKDAVDDVIEKVLSSGGDVEFVEEGLLANYNRIVLIEYYGYV